MASAPERSAEKSEKAEVRAHIFSDLAGIVLVPTINALSDRGLFQLFAGSAEPVPFEKILNHTRGNRGYLRVALRLLTSYGWLRSHLEKDGVVDTYSLTSEGELAAKLTPILYGEVIAFFSKALLLSDSLMGKTDTAILSTLDELAQRAHERWGLGTTEDPLFDKVHRQIRSHLDGILVGPAIVAMARGGVLAQLGETPTSIGTLPGSLPLLRTVFNLLAMRGWAVVEADTVRLTARGMYATQIASSYGVTVSYLPTLNKLSVLLFGNPRIPRFDDSGVELLVDRAVNVWGSGGAHRTYFNKVDEIVLDIFNRPLHLQPKGICDMGCGDGTFLEHLYSVVKSSTARGQALDTHPLILVGADFNKVARRVSKQTLQRAGIPTFFVVPGDINRPAQLASDFEALELDIHEFFHVRSFLDHNRPYLPPANYVSGTRKPRTTGVFARLGEEIPADELEENLVRHLRRWAPYTGRFGLLILELHTIPPIVAAANLDGTHGYSDQYLVEVPVFLDCAREAGLRANPRYQAVFPPSELATVSINLFAAPNAGENEFEHHATVLADSPAHR
jgi:hypothetical protein